jgi:hypothetical protein
VFLHVLWHYVQLGFSPEAPASTQFLAVVASIAGFMVALPVAMVIQSLFTALKRSIG